MNHKDYKYEYINYKTKYFRLRESLGLNVMTGMTGGGDKFDPYNPYFDNNMMLTIFAPLDIPNYTDSNSRPKFILHNININKDNENAKLFMDKQFQDLIKRAYVNNLKNLTLQSSFDYKNTNNDIIKVYVLDPKQQNNITKFRRDIDDYLENIIKINPNYGLVKKDNNYYHTYNFNNKPLYAVSDLYYGKGNWVPVIKISPLHTKVKSYADGSTNASNLIDQEESRRNVLNTLSSINLNEVNDLELFLQDNSGNINENKLISIN